MPSTAPGWRGAACVTDFTLLEHSQHGFGSACLEWQLKDLANNRWKGSHSRSQLLTWAWLPSQHRDVVIVGEERAGSKGLVLNSTPVSARACGNGVLLGASCFGKEEWKMRLKPLDLLPRALGAADGQNQEYDDLSL